MPTELLRGDPDQSDDSPNEILDLSAAQTGCDSKRCRVGSVWIDLAGGLG